MENTYTKVYTLKGYYFTKEYKKTVKGKRVVREILDETVRKHFKNHDCNIEVYFEESGRLILITPDSPEEDIIKHLGENFLPK